MTTTMQPGEGAGAGVGSNTESNKALARRWVEAVNQRDEAALRAILSDDFLYSGMGRTRKELSVRWDKDQFVTTVLSARTRARKPVVMTVVRALAEGNRVTLETDGYGEMKDGFVYANAYCLLYEIEGGKIRAVRDYCCTRTAVVASQHA
jgi:ketosteroid isomerase-like protein